MKIFIFRLSMFSGFLRETSNIICFDKTVLAFRNSTFCASAFCYALIINYGNHYWFIQILIQIFTAAVDYDLPMFQNWNQGKTKNFFFHSNSFLNGICNSWNKFGAESLLHWVFLRMRRLLYFLLAHSISFSFCFCFKFVLEKNWNTQTYMQLFQVIEIDFNCDLYDSGYCRGSDL